MSDLGRCDNCFHVFVAVLLLSHGGCWGWCGNARINCMLSESCRLVGHAWFAYLHRLHFSFTLADAAVIEYADWAANDARSGYCPCAQCCHIRGFGCSVVLSMLFQCVLCVIDGKVIMCKHKISGHCGQSVVDLLRKWLPWWMRDKAVICCLCLII